MMVNNTGHRLGKYEIGERLGRGGMAEVYKAFQPGLERYVAVKVLTGYFAESPQFVARFKREARAIAQLRHHHIVQVFDFDVQDEWYYMVMEYLQGGTLHQRVQQYGALPRADVVRIGAALADALDYAHQHHMIHRDIKPANVMFADDGLAHPILTDFGIARIIGETALTTSGFIGTPGYISPEVARSEPVDERSDIYSMGIMLYEMVTGRLPFYGDTPFAVVMKHVHEPLPSMRQYATGIPESLEEVVYKALAKRTDLRYQTAGELRDALLALGDIPAAPVADWKALVSQATTEAENSAYTPVLESMPVALTPVLDMNTRQLQPEEITEEAEPRRRRRKPLLLLLIALLLAGGGFIILNGSGLFTAQDATPTQPVLLVAPDTVTPTMTYTPSPTEEPPTNTLTPTNTPEPTDTARPTLMIPTRTLEPSDTRTPTPTRTPTRVPPTNPPAPPPTTAPVSNPTADSGGQQEQPPPENNDVVGDTVDTVEDVVDGVGDVLDDVTGGLGLP